MKILQSAALAALLAGLMRASDASAAPLTLTFSTLPADGRVTGQAGQLIGWGYQLTNTDVSNWFVPTQLSASSSTLGTPDASYFDFPLLAPGARISAGFDNAAMRGLYGLRLFDFATPGQNDSGQFTLSGEWWTGDPFGGGQFIQSGDNVFAAFSAQVVAAPAAVPVPGTLVLFGLGLPLLLRARERRGQKVEQRGAGSR